MFKFSEVAKFNWTLGQTRNRWIYNHLYDNHSFWLKFNRRNERSFK